MRTSINIDRKLADRVMKELGVHTIKEAVDKSLREILARKKRLKLLQENAGRHDIELPPDDPFAFQDNGGE